MNETTILVVEDEPLVGLEIQDDLVHLGYHVPDVVTRGDEVEEAVRRHQPELVLLDIRLQGPMDGIQAAERIRRTSDVPLLFLTAYSDPETLGRAAQVLPDGYLLKPFGERELAASVKLALHKAKAPLLSERNLTRMVPLLDTLAQGLALFDGRGRWFHGNPAACKVFKAAAEGPGPHLAVFLQLTPREFEVGPAFWVAQGFPPAPGLALDVDHTMTVEPLPDLGGRPGGFLVTLHCRTQGEEAGPDLSFRAVNQTLADLLPHNRLFLPRIDSAGFLIPSDEGTGDFYDLFPLGPHHFVFYNLDVEGLGPVPAMVAYSLRSEIRNLVGTYLSWNDEVPSPALILKALNEKYDCRTGGSLFFTISLGIVSPVTGEFSLVRAGHTCTLWLRADGSQEWLRGEGTALGAFPEVSFEVQSGRLQNGDRLVLCSDGLLEALGHRDMDQGYSVLAELMGRRPGQDIEELVQIVQQAGMVARREHSDDMSLLVLGPQLW